MKSHNDKQLKAISEVYRIDFNALIRIKSNASKVWVESDGDYIIAFTTIDSDTPQVATRYCPITKKERDALLKIQPIKTPKIPKANKVINTKVDNTVEVSNVTIDDLIPDFDIILDLDTILEKISATGMKSLTKTELEFLNNLSK
jgi:hypothetical protein